MDVKHPVSPSPGWLGQAFSAAGWADVLLSDCFHEGEEAVILQRVYAEETWRGRGPSVGGEERWFVKANGVSAPQKDK